MCTCICVYVLLLWFSLFSADPLCDDVECTGDLVCKIRRIRGVRRGVCRCDKGFYRTSKDSDVCFPKTPGSDNGGSQQNPKPTETFGAASAIATGTDPNTGTDTGATTTTDAGGNTGGKKEDGGAGCNVQCDLGQQLLELVNQLRAENGLRKLCLNNKLSAAARAHSTDMKDNGSFSHDGSDGSKYWDRFARAGFDLKNGCEKCDGENVANGYYDAQSVFEAWRNSEGHLQNMLSDSTYMGSYLAGKYWTQEFASSDNESCNN